MQRHWLYLATAVLWLAAAGFALRHQRPGYATVAAAIAALNLVAYDRTRPY